MDLEVEESKDDEVRWELNKNGMCLYDKNLSVVFFLMIEGYVCPFGSDYGAEPLHGQLCDSAYQTRSRVSAPHNSACDSHSL